MGIKSLTGSDCVVSAALYIYAFDGSGALCVLAGRRGSTAPTGAGLLNPVMGMLDEGESAEDAAVREAFEETGLDVCVSDIEDMGIGASGRNRSFCLFLDVLTDDISLGSGDGENEQFSWRVVSSLDLGDWAFGTGHKAVDFSYAFSLV
jgi:ADP-ribose pyrophosphatase